MPPHRYMENFTEHQRVAQVKATSCRHGPSASNPYPWAVARQLSFPFDLQSLLCARVTAPPSSLTQVTASICYKVKKKSCASYPLLLAWSQRRHCATFQPRVAPFSSHVLSFLLSPWKESPPPHLQKLLVPSSPLTPIIFKIALRIHSIQEFCKTWCCELLIVFCVILDVSIGIADLSSDE